MEGLNSPAVHAAEIAGTVAQVDMSLFSLITKADFVVQMVMLMLIVSSVWCWAIVFEKWMKYKAISIKSESFEKKFWSGQVLDQLYEKLKARPSHPLAVVFCAAMSEWSKNPSVVSDYGVKRGIKERLSQSMNNAINKEVAQLSSQLQVLATVGSSAPFIGLFGTVWGIMHSFQSIAASKNSTLAVVAPGIAEALLATAIGLFAAIPAVIFYNLLNAKLNNISEKMEIFSSDLETLLSRELDNQR
ncbi:MAG: protein TolQ [Alphaproteobacteria bacterium]|mgnify:CR=1 FL=1|nr:protein TolQ [Alphaproteobacteria bacterium]OJV13602.1 MAG: protein TolQ [Alphaproteobacteria bacterium 33-17]